MEEEDPGPAAAPSRLMAHHWLRRTEPCVSSSELTVDQGGLLRALYLPPSHLILSKLCKAGGRVRGYQGSERGSDLSQITKGKHNGGIEFTPRPGCPQSQLSQSNMEQDM